jgi:hypothetical protein
LCDTCYESLQVVAEAEQIVSANREDHRFSKAELDKLDHALFSAVAQSTSGKAHDLFFVLMDLRTMRDMAEGRLVPSPGAMPITGSGEFLAELVETGYRLLGIPAGR